ncbi:conserved hypothetical protein [Streptomyces sp. SPB074]|nr:DUF4291 domain-containing protein [Streptomyces sp. SPB074]EFG65447.1 conserved hypothetical protein [Streptomyces sp. SPB074]
MESYERPGHGAGRGVQDAGVQGGEFPPPAASPPEIPRHQVRALHTADTLTVYQAYRPSLGLPAARDGRFPPEWGRERMTWIKPSFLWMMYRCGWGTKEGQETVLAVEITRAGFLWALRHAALSHYEAATHGSREAWRRALRGAPARVQWDPERDPRGRALAHRSLQLGLSGEASRRYADEWTVGIRDVTPLAREAHARVREGRPEAARALLPVERPYEVPADALAGLLPAPRATGGGA